MYRSLFVPFINGAKTFVLDTLFPVYCLICEKEGEFVCLDCKSRLSKLEHQRCIVCQKPAIFGLTHEGCKTPHGADGLISFYNYHDENVAKIIIEGKYYFLSEVYKILGKLISERIKVDHSHLLTLNSYLLVPIPLHPSRKRWRGFNQAQLLCQTLSTELSLQVQDVLMRKKRTKTQKDLKKDQRQKNVDGAFAINIKLPSPILGEGSGERLKIQDNPVKDKNFILVDDVTTTGATLQEAAKVLKRNGAAKVICLTVARD